jgi:hypothetical protein
MERHTPETIDTVQKCAVCQGAIAKKPVKRMGKLYCSVYCAEVNRERMENLDMDKIDFSELGGVVERFMKTCMECPFPKKCRELRGICSSYFEELHDYISMRWCCHAIFGLSCMLSDGSVSLETVKKVMARAEEICREGKHQGVSPAILAMAEGELVSDFSYEPAPDIRPPVPEEEHEHYLACLQCEKDFMDECLRMTAEAEAFLPEVEALIDYRYCGHARYDLAAMLQNPKVSKEKVKHIIAKSKKIADEKNFKGGQYRIHFLSVGRSIDKD